LLLRRQLHFQLLLCLEVRQKRKVENK
jgi:hypothetical protein